jgi:hypothetical protein
MSDPTPTSNLPPEFSDLEGYFPEWCTPAERARAAKRVSTDIEVLRAFNAHLAPRMEAIIHYLNGFPNDPLALPPQAQRLYWLAQMVMEASVPIDLQWNSSDIEDVFPLERMTFTAGAPGRLAR